MYGIEKSRELNKEKQQEERMSVQLSAAQEQYDTLLQNVEQIKGMKHDMKHHFLMIEQLLRDDKRQELQSYLAHISGISDVELVPFGENYAISVLATFFKDQADRDGIRFTCSVQVPRELNLPTETLTGILGNMWQNALEACQSMTDGERYIRTRILYKQNKLILRCENSFAGTICPGTNGALLRSTKGERRGQGIASIQRLAKAHGGNCFYEQEDGKFFLTVVLLGEVKNAETGEQEEAKKNVSNSDLR
jgi:sensor histidine kinase regulating citrate/malate metabolism